MTVAAALVIQLTPLGCHARSVSGQEVECDGCGAFVPRLARFRDERAAEVLLCQECEADVLEEIEAIRVAGVDDDW